MGVWYGMDVDGVNGIGVGYWLLSTDPVLQS